MAKVKTKHVHKRRRVPVQSVIRNDADRYPCCNGEARIPNWDASYSRTCPRCGTKWTVTRTLFGADWRRA